MMASAHVSEKQIYSGLQDRKKEMTEFYRFPDFLRKFRNKNRGHADDVWFHRQKYRTYFVFVK